jgi:hypothetical protein
VTKVTDSITLNLNVFLRSLVTAVGIIVFMATLKCVCACVLVLHFPARILSRVVLAAANPLVAVHVLATRMVLDLIRSPLMTL